MKIVDSQIHIWENERMSPPHGQVDNFTLGEALREMAEAVRRYPDKFCILGYVDLESPDRPAIVQNWRERPGVLGFRYTLARPYQQSWWRDGSLEWLWSACEEEGLPIGPQAGAHLPEFRRIAEGHPCLKLHIDHQGRCRAIPASPIRTGNVRDDVHRRAVLAPGT